MHYECVTIGAEHLSLATATMDCADTRACLKGAAPSLTRCSTFAQRYFVLLVDALRMHSYNAYPCIAQALSTHRCKTLLGDAGC